MPSQRFSMMHLLLYSSVALTASAATLPKPLARRMEDCQIDVEEEMADDPNRANTDGTAGIGAEFESVTWTFRSAQCSEDDTNAAKRKVIAERTGTNWALTADSIGKAGTVQAEYILDGTQIKVGSTDDATKGSSVAADLVNDLREWKPWANDDTRNVDIADSNPWAITLRKNQDPDKIYFQPQITTPMPLDGLYSLMKEQYEDPDTKNPLDGTLFRNQEVPQFVTQDTFQSNPSGIDKTTVKDDVLGFCTLVLSYAKGAKKSLQPGQSPKNFQTFMPRTHFNKIFSHVSARMPAKGDDLFKLFENLACYTSNAAAVDTDLCEGDVTSPTPLTGDSGTKFSELTFAQGDDTMSIKDWIFGLDPDSQDNDALTDFDKLIDGSIGNLGATQEKMFNSERSVPLFEFRDLDPSTQVSTMEKFMSDVDSAIQKLHTDYANPPARRVKRQDSVCAAPEPEEPEPEPTGPTKQVAVISTYLADALTLDWHWLIADYQQGVECRDDYIAPTYTEEWDLSGAHNWNTYPGGTFDLDLEIDGQACQYKNDGDDPGALWCGEKEILCQDDPADKDNDDPTADKGIYTCGEWIRQPVFVCPY